MTREERLHHLPSRAAIAGVEVNDPLDPITVTRKTRSTTNLVDHMKDIVNVVSGGTYRSSTELQSWASSALNSPGLGKGVFPLDGDDDIRVHYEPYFDDLRVDNVAVINYAPTNPTTPIDYGIGQNNARTKAVDVFDDLQLGSVIGWSWSDTPTREYSIRRTKIESATTSTAWERMYVFVFRRYWDGFPVLDAKLEIGIGAHENPAKVAFIRLGDVDVEASTGTKYAEISSDDLREEFERQAILATTPAPDSLTLSQEFIGYLLDPRTDEDDVWPQFHASFETLHGDNVSHGRAAAIDFYQVDRHYEWEVLYPWEGATPDPDPRFDGAACIGGGQCSSGECFMAGSFGGICGECSDDSDCTSGKVCDHPRLDAGFWTPSQCVTPALGTGCTDVYSCGAGLQCETIFYSPALFPVKTCSECEKDSNCSGSDVCAPVLDLPNMKASLQCITNASLSTDELCEDDNECSSGLCRTANLGGLGDVGVCSECRDDEDCGSTETCTSPLATIFGLSGAVCV